MIVKCPFCSFMCSRPIDLNRHMGWTDDINHCRSDIQGKLCELLFKESETPKLHIQHKPHKSNIDKYTPKSREEIERMFYAI